MKRSVLLSTLALCLVFFILHRLALSLSLYWIFPQLDYLMHAIGGCIIGLLTVLFSKNKKHIVFWAFLFGLIMSIFWEYFEFSIGATFVHSSYYFDTFMDVIVGVGSAMLSAFIVFTEHNE